MTELYERVRAAFNARDKEAWIEITAPDLYNTPPRNWPESAVTSGSEEVWYFLVNNFETLETGDIEHARPPIEGDGCLLVSLRSEVRGRGSGVPIEWAYEQVAWFRDGKLARLAWFEDREEALEVAGIEAPADV